MNRLIPRSLSAQFIFVLVGILIFAQILNIYVLIGERRFVARDAHSHMLIDIMAEEAARLPNITAQDLPIILVEGPSVAGSIFLSTVNHSELPPNSAANKSDAKRLQNRLTESGLTPLQTFAIRHVITTNESGVLPPPRQGRSARPPAESGRPPPPRGGGPRRPARENGLAPQQPPERNEIAPGLEEVIFSSEIQPGIWLNTVSRHYSSEAITMRALIATGLTLIIAILAAILLARRIAKPIKKLSVAAEKLGRGETIEPIAETGPADVRAATHAFNTMQRRLTRLIEEQRATLRALGHDLRTPLTSLRIRAEDLPEEHGRTKFISALDNLSKMTTEILSWSKDASAVEDVVSLDIVSLIASISDDYADAGSDVVFDDPGEPLIAVCRRFGLRRALINLTDNALKYGGNATLSVERFAEIFCIHIDDNGPGIPEDSLADVLTPFTRLETSRNRGTGGIGLGLSIANSIAQAHGGQLILSNRPEGGLRASLRLPLALNKTSKA